MNITRYEPHQRSLGLLSRLLDEDFNRFLRTTTEADSVSNWRPAVDIHEDDGRFIIKADLPGVAPENIAVAMEDGVLTIQGERTTVTEDAQDACRRHERVHGAFLRRFNLPDTADGEQISATTRHGVLEITIPKQARREPSKIDIQVL